MSTLQLSQSREEKNALFTVLSNHRRRYALFACNQTDGETTLSDVAEQVASWEYEKPISEVTSAERKRVYTSIQQHHLSKLEQAGLVTVEKDRIRSTEMARNLDIYLDVVPEKNIPWAIYYLALSGIGAFTVGIAHVGWLPEQISPTIVGLGFAILVGLSATTHALQSRRMKLSSSDVPPEIGG